MQMSEITESDRGKKAPSLGRKLMRTQTSESQASPQSPWGVNDCGTRAVGVLWPPACTAAGPGLRDVCWVDEDLPPALLGTDWGCGCAGPLASCSLMPQMNPRAFLWSYPRKSTVAVPRARSQAVSPQPSGSGRDSIQSKHWCCPRHRWSAKEITFCWRILSRLVLHGFTNAEKFKCDKK